MAYRTFNCGELTLDDLGQSVTLAGWVDTIRDHGGVAFIDLRDEYGVTQVVVNDDTLIYHLKKESVISVEGVVVKRDEETVNKKIKTGELEVKVDKLTVLGACTENLPFEISDSKETREDVRLTYRFLDLRNKAVHDNILFRSQVVSFLRKKMESLGFTEITTPILTCSSPEGARDYIIPSRKHEGKFYALPQAPQQFKQLLMCPALTNIFRSRRVSGTRMPAQTVLPVNFTSWILKWRLQRRKMFSPLQRMCFMIRSQNSAAARLCLPRRL